MHSRFVRICSHHNGRSCQVHCWNTAVSSKRPGLRTFPSTYISVPCRKAYRRPKRQFSSVVECRKMWRLWSVISLLVLWATHCKLHWWVSVYDPLGGTFLQDTIDRSHSLNQASRIFGRDSHPPEQKIGMSCSGGAAYEKRILLRLFENTELGMAERTRLCPRSKHISYGCLRQIENGFTLCLLVNPAHKISIAYLSRSQKES